MTFAIVENSTTRLAELDVPDITSAVLSVLARYNAPSDSSMQYRIRGQRAVVRFKNPSRTLSITPNG